MILAGDYRSVGTIQSNRSRAQTDQSHRGTVLRAGQASGKIKFHVRARSRTGKIRTECLELDLGLAQCSSESARRNIEGLVLWRFCNIRIILIVYRAAIVKQVQ